MNNKKLISIIFLIVVVSLLGFGYKFYEFYRIGKAVDVLAILPEKKGAVRVDIILDPVTNQYCKNNDEGYKLVIPKEYSDLSITLGRPCSLFYKEIHNEKYALNIIKGREYLKLNHLSFDEYFTNREFRQYQYNFIGDALVKNYWFSGKNNDYLIEIMRNEKEQNYSIYAYTENKNGEMFSIRYATKYLPIGSDISEVYGVLNSVELFSQK